MIDNIIPYVPDATIKYNKEFLEFHFVLTFSHYSSAEDFNGLIYEFNYSNEIPYNAFYFYKFLTNIRDYLLQN